MTFDSVTRLVVSPVFFFLSVVIMSLAAASLYAAMMINTVYIVISCILFVLAFNAFRMGWKLFTSQD